MQPRTGPRQGINQGSRALLGLVLIPAGRAQKARQPAGQGRHRRVPVDDALLRVAGALRGVLRPAGCAQLAGHSRHPGAELVGQ